MQDLASLVKRISSDASFRQELAAAPEATLNKYDFVATADVVKTIKGLDDQGLVELAASYGSDKAAC